jgi:hypothetical protein
MKNKIALFFFFTFLFTINFSSASQNFTSASLEVSVDIPATMEWAEVELNTTSIDFGELNLSGSASDKRKSAYYEIRNRGNVNITVTPVLADSVDAIFENLKFARLISDPLSAWRELGDYSIQMNATSSDNSWSAWQKYSIRLDLMNYLSSGEEIPFNIINHKNNVIFEVMPRYE